MAMRFPYRIFRFPIEFYTATFFGDREEVELTVNSLYRGT